jgi:hypothetical protein
MIVLDLNLPDSTGWATSKALVQYSAMTPIVIVTGGLTEPRPLGRTHIVGKEDIGQDPHALLQVVQGLLQEDSADGSSSVSVTPG